MALARWPHLKQLLDESLRRSGADREAYLRDACGGDAELRHEVESLAAAYDDAGAFLEAPVSAAVSGVTRLLSTLDTVGAQPRAPGAPETLAAGTLINDRYRIEAIVGEGGMGSVYRVYDTAMSRTVALKTIRGRPQFLNLFKIEFRTLVELRHPHLAQCHDFEPIAGSADYCFTMEFVQGRNILEATEGMGWLAVVDLLVQLCRVLAYVHNRGIVHRDIKATNVLVRADGTVKLVDFGLVGSAGDADHVIGTPAYLAPELIDRGAGDHRSDLYSLGILAYQLICRRLPFPGLTPADVLYQHASAPPRFPDRVDAPEWLQKVILRLCAKLPSDRYRSANQVIEGINSEGNLHHPIETAVTRESYVLSGRFVGRHDELAALSTFVEQRLAGERGGASAVALVRGQSGIGKSRLLRELRHAVQLNRHTFVEGNCFEGAADEYGALADVIAQLVPLVDARGASELVARDAAGLATLAPGIGRSRDLSPPPPLVSAEAERLRLIDTVAAFLLDATRVLPYVLYINDLQWAQKGTVDVLGHLHRRVTLDERRGIEVPLAIIGSYRPMKRRGGRCRCSSTRSRTPRPSFLLRRSRPRRCTVCCNRCSGSSIFPRVLSAAFWRKLAAAPSFSRKSCGRSWKTGPCSWRAGPGGQRPPSAISRSRPALSPRCAATSGWSSTPRSSTSCASSPPTRNRCRCRCWRRSRTFVSKTHTRRCAI